METLADRLLELLEKTKPQVKVKEPTEIEKLLATRDVQDAIRLGVDGGFSVKQITTALNTLMETKIKAARFKEADIRGTMELLGIDEELELTGTTNANLDF